MRQDFDINSIYTYLEKKRRKDDDAKQLEKYDFLIDARKDSLMIFVDEFTEVLAEFISISVL